MDLSPNSAPYWLCALRQRASSSDLGLLAYIMGIVMTVPSIHSPEWPSPLLDCPEQEIQVPALWEVPLAAPHPHCRAG